MGPSAIVVDKARSGLIYVALFDVAEAGQEEGEIAVLSPGGEHLRSIKLPGPEVSGLALSPDGSFLVATEASTGGIHRIGL
jgi:sugar lactone lactonase YvrE